MGLEHEFLLVQEPLQTTEVWLLRENVKVIVELVIHDEIILYILDSLEWIPRKNPAKEGNPSSQGLHYHGITLFDEQSADSLTGIFTAWKNLFEHAPSTFVLTGNFIYGETEEAGEYERIPINRDEIVRQFEKMISMADQLATGRYSLYHLGI